MVANFLEQLVAEWYEYKGYIVRRNVQVGKRTKGGYECELDIVAFDPVHKHLIQIEPSSDSDSWIQREKRYKKKFTAGKRHIPGLFRGLKAPSRIEQVAVLVWAGRGEHSKLAGGKVVLLRELLEQIFSELKKCSLSSNAVPEKFAILRTLQCVTEYRKRLRRVLFED